MPESRRHLLAGLCCVAGVFGAEPLLAGLQAPAPGSGASPRAKVYPNGRDPNAPQGLEPSTPNPKAIELANQKALRADIAKLYEIDRKSTRLNSSHSQISYAVFCLK